MKSTRELELETALREVIMLASDPEAVRSIAASALEGSSIISSAIEHERFCKDAYREEMHFYGDKFDKARALLKDIIPLAERVQDIAESESKRSDSLDEALAHAREFVKE